MLRYYAWPITIVVSTLLAGLAVRGDAGMLRSGVIVWFLAICPGMAFVPLLRLEARVRELVLALALSITMSTLVSEVLALTNVWAPAAGLYVLMGVSGLGVLLQVLSAPRR